jgi:hypothetical protein
MDIPSPSVQIDRPRRSQLSLASRRGQSTLSLADLTSAIPQAAIKSWIGFFVAFSASTSFLGSRIVCSGIPGLARNQPSPCQTARKSSRVIRYSNFISGTNALTGVTIQTPHRVGFGSPCAALWHFLAEQLQSNQCFVAIQAVHATLARASQRSCRIHQLFGCTLYIAPRSSKWNVHDFFEDFLIHCLRWAFNPRRSRQRSFHLNRIEIWISAADLKSRFAAVGPPHLELVMSFGGLCSPEQYAAPKIETIEVAGD